MNLFGILGTMSAMGIVVLACCFVGPLGVFVNIPSAIVVAGLTLGLQLSTVGMRESVDALRALTVIARKEPGLTVRPENAATLRTMARHLHAAGGIALLIGGIQILASVDDWSQLGPAMAMMLLAVFYALVLAECIARPCAKRIDFLLAEEP